MTGTSHSESGVQMSVNTERTEASPAGGTTGMFLIVLFLISLFAFGRAPYSLVVERGGGRFTFDFLSCAGIVGGLLGVVFLVRVLCGRIRLASVKTLLGLISTVGLILHTALALFAPLSWATGVPPTHGTGRNPVLGRGGPEVWEIDGRRHRIAMTYYLKLREGLQFTIEYPHEFGDSIGRMNDERALAIVFPLMKHAFENHLHERVKLSKLGTGALQPSRIGITMFQSRGGQTRGYRVALTLQQIQERIARASEN